MIKTKLPIKNLPAQGFCGECDDLVDFHVEFFKDRLHKVKDVEVISDEYIAICNHCGNHIWIDEIEEYNCKVIYDLYKKKVGLLTTEEIKAIRKKRGMSQRDLARFLSLGEKDITRYENGSIQTRMVDLMIRMVDDDQGFKTMTRVINRTKELTQKAQ